jgi:hypothetical protein
MRSQRFFTFLLVLLPSVAVATGVFVASALSSHDGPEKATVLVAATAAPGDDGASADVEGADDLDSLAVGDSHGEARLLHATAQRLLSERKLAAITARENAQRARAARLAARQERARLAAERAARLRASRSALRAAAPAAAPEPGYEHDVWTRLRNCEAGGNYQRNSGNGFYGAYQFAPGTWRSLGYPGMPHQAPPEQQDEAARRLQARSGWGQWPACSRRIGAR